MTPVETRRFTTEEVAATSPDGRRLRVCISTYDLDDADRRVDQTGWDFTTFAKNPVILWAHDDRGYTGSNGIPVAKGVVETIVTEGQKTFMEFEFPPEGVFALADTLYELARLGYVNAVSVGWNPLQVEYANENGREIRIFRRQELLEVSLVTLPSNSNALIQRASARKAEADEGKKLTESLENAAREQGEDLAAAEEIKQFKPSHLLKCARYMERKQPANKASTAVLKKFFGARGEKQPDDEVAAWKLMEELMEKAEKIVVEEENEPVTPAIESPVEAKVEEPAPEPEEKKEEITTPITEPAEAPQAGRKASAPPSLADFRRLAPELSKALAEAAAAALRQGVPVKDIPGVLDAVAAKLKASLISSPSPQP